MALFQPSQVLPDVRSGLGSGTVDVTQDLDVSWRINGPSAMTDYQITIYANDANSTQLYTTNKQTLSTPVYGTDSTGAIQFFTHTIDAADLSTATITNGNEYKLIIRQWWGATDAESVTQTSASVFLTRSAPTVAVSVTSGDVIATRDETFTGTYTQAQGDVLNWLRWRVGRLEADGGYTVLYDTGNISGTMDLSCYYDGFFTGTGYAVRLSVQTENGVEADTGWVDFTVSYPTVSIEGSISAGCVGGTDAVAVDWADIGIIPGVAIPSNGYSISGDYKLTLQKGASINWYKVGTKTMSFAPPWSVVWKGTLGYESAPLIFAVTQDNNNELVFRYDVSTHSLILEENGTALATQTGIINAPTVTAILTPTTLYLRCEYLTGGLYPATDLYPGTTLYPRADTVENTDTYTIALSYTQGAIGGVVIGGYQVCDFLEVIKGTASATTVTQAITNGDYTPGSNDADYMLADWTSGIDAGQLSLGQNVIGWALYRGDTAGNFVKVGETEATVGKLYDYGALSQQGPYTYYLFPIGKTTYISTAIESNLIAPCWWNWTLMECAATADASIYTVLTAWRFRFSVESGAMSNNNAPAILQNFTAFPKVQLVPQNYKSASLTGLIGVVDWTNGQPQYVDTIAWRDALMALSLSTNPLFLKSRKGELLRVRLSAAVTSKVADATPEQMQTVTVPWVEVGSAAGVSLYSTAWVAAQESEGSVAPSYTVDTADGTATQDDIRFGLVAYSQGKRLVGTLPDGNGVGF